MISSALDWYFGSQDEELLADCEFGEPYPAKRSPKKDICVRPATLNTGLQVTIFTQVKTKPKEVTTLEKCSKQLKLLRHPNILQHIGCVVMETQVHLVTERVSPLYLQFQTADANEVAGGIYDIAQGLKFLHEKAGITHNNVCLESIFVTEGGAWKLSNFEWACRFNEATCEFLVFAKRPEDIIPPEESNKNTVFPIESKFAHSRDAYAVGVLLAKFNKQTRFASQVPTQELEDLLDEILQKDYKKRPPMAEILETTALSSEYISIVNFLHSITLKTAADKTRFFSKLIPRLQESCVSDELIAKRIAKLLLTPVILSEQEAVDLIIPHLLTPIPIRMQPSTSGKTKGLISSSMFARYVIPQIVDLLQIRILHVRLVLVNHFHRYVHMFDQSVLKEVVLPEILLGLHDSNNQLVKASIHALADAVPMVGGDVIVGTEREKIFSFGMPKFNGSVLVDASAIACEMKPKRKPKKPKKKRSEEKRPATLLELAMTKERPSGSPTAGKPQRQRDLMLLKQNELSMTFGESHSNGGLHNKERETFPVKERGKKTKKEENSGKKEESSGNERKTEPKINGFPKEKQINEKPGEIQKPVVLPNVNVNHCPNQSKPEQPEVETWANSGSDVDDDNWDDFDNFSSGEAKRGGEGVTMTNTELNSAVKVQMSDHPKVEPTKLPDKSNPVVNHGRGDQLLGNEFEIAVKVKPPTPEKELDFFADMVPEIKAQKVVSVPTLQEISPQKRGSLTSNTTSTKSSPVSVSFYAVKDDPVSDGWGDDTVEWDDD